LKSMSGYTRREKKKGTAKRRDKGAQPRGRRDEKTGPDRLCAAKEREKGEEPIG